MATNHIAPQLVLEVEVSNESMPILAERDLARYFGPGTGTRWWIGIKVFKSDTGGVHRWWAGHAKRAFVQGAFIDEAEFSPESMDRVENNNDPITIATDKVFHVDVATLVHPCALPPNYPPMLDINLEEIRKVIVSWIQ
jgi:hypothetical protein